MFPNVEGSSQKMLLLTEPNKLCKGLFIMIINNLRPSSRDVVPKCCISRAPKESGKCCEVAVRRDEEGCFVKVNLEIATDNLISQCLIAIQIGVLRGAFSGKEVRGFGGSTGKSLVFLN